MNPAALLLAIAAQEHFPHCYPISGGGEGNIFFYDFVFQNPIETSVLPFIEEKMYQDLSKISRVKISEMMRENARDYLKHKRRHFPSELIKHSRDSIVKIIEMDDFIDVLQGDYVLPKTQIKALKLKSVEQRSDATLFGKQAQVLRIYGVFAKDKYELKKVFKSESTLQIEDELFLGQRLNLFLPRFCRDERSKEYFRVTWLEEGTLFFRSCLNIWIKLQKDRHAHFVSTQEHGGKQDHRWLLENQYRHQKNSIIRISEYLMPDTNILYECNKGLSSLSTKPFDINSLMCSKSQLKKELEVIIEQITTVIELFELKYSIEAQLWKNQELEFFKKSRVSYIKNEKPCSIIFLIASTEDMQIPGPIIKITETNEGVMLRYSIFHTLQMFLSFILLHKEKDLSQKKELLFKITNSTQKE